MQEEKKGNPKERTYNPEEEPLVNILHNHTPSPSKKSFTSKKSKVASPRKKGRNHIKEEKTDEDAKSGADQNHFDGLLKGQRKAKQDEKHNQKIDLLADQRRLLTKFKKQVALRKHL